MKNRLKHFRVQQGLTQSKVAKAVGVSQPTVQRWESGFLDIPEAKISRLAKFLKTTPDALLNRHPPVRAAFYDDSAPEELQYYGEVAIHFRSGAKALLLSISEEQHRLFYRNLQDDSKFLNIRDLGNRLIVLRREALSDVYFSSEAYDDFGPEHDTYEDGTPVHLPDPRDWHIIHSIATGGPDEDDYAKEDVERVAEAVMITDEQYEKLVADGLIKPEDLETEKAKNTATTERIFELAGNVIYQITNGPRRVVGVWEPSVVFEAFYQVVEFESPMDDDITTCRLATDGYHRTIFINPNAVDYISIPTHLYDEGELESNDESISSMPDDDADEDSGKVVKLPQTKRRRRGRRRAHGLNAAAAEG